jgi:hypothetical protein
VAKIQRLNFATEGSNMQTYQMCVKGLPNARIHMKAVARGEVRTIVELQSLGTQSAMLSDSVQATFRRLIKLTNMR